MSRALDAETIASVQQSTAPAYIDIVKALSTKTDELLEIEFLGKSHPLPEGCNVLLDGNSVAIPKIKLVQAFVVARHMLFTQLKEGPAKNEEELRNATAIILLMDPEHLTAANTRKRIIQTYLSCPRSKVEPILKNELYFVDSYLTSRLHRHTKSPTLWGHRRWILEMSKSIQVDHDIEKDLKSIVLVAAERHPRNYYAWSHMRWLLEALPRKPSLEPTTHLPPNRHANVVSIVKDWCLRHPSDTSGFSFLLFCLLRTAPTDARSASERYAERSEICKEVLKLAVLFRWTHESVWAFLRTLVAAERSSGDTAEFYLVVENILLVDPDEKPAVKSAREWCMKFQEN